MSLNESDAEYVPSKRKHRLTIAIPASLVEDTPHLREKTSKIGLVGRSCAIFRIENILIYFDKTRKNQYQDAELIENILKYMDIPQYLRKTLIKIEPRLRFVGVLPPLKAPHHQVTQNRRSLRPGMLRQGIVIGSRDGFSLIDIGLDDPVSIEGQLSKNQRITVVLTNVDKDIEVAPLDDSEIRIYWGYNVTVSKLPLAESTRKIGFDLVVSTSRYGKKIGEVLPELQTAWTKSKNILIAFGSPTEGLQQILAEESLGPDQYAHYTLNMIPQQGVETIRTEEAICACLSILNILG